MGDAASFLTSNFPSMPAAKESRRYRFKKGKAMVCVRSFKRLLNGSNPDLLIPGLGLCVLKKMNG